MELSGLRTLGLWRWLSQGVVFIYFQVIAAEGEQKASRALKEAAEVMSESPATIQLRYLQTLNTIAADNNSTIVFPLPIDLFSAFQGKGK